MLKNIVRSASFLSMCHIGEWPRQWGSGAAAPWVGRSHYFLGKR